MLMGNERGGLVQLRERLKVLSLALAAIALLAAGGGAIAEPWMGVDSSKPPRLTCRTVKQARGLLAAREFYQLITNQ